MTNQAEAYGFSPMRFEGDLTLVHPESVELAVSLVLWLVTSSLLRGCG
jgi:hypothetical protein